MLNMIKINTNSIQKTLLKVMFTLVVTIVIFVIGAFSASAASSMQKKAVEYTDRSLSVEATAVLYDSRMKSKVKTARNLNEKFGVRTDKAKALSLTDEEISKVAERIAKSSKIYQVTLQSGEKTYYIAVDLKTEDSMYLYNPFVLRQTAEKLLKRVEKLAGKRANTMLLMDYTHIVGELSTHLMGYKMSNNLGGEKSIGLIKYVYDSCAVADLNVDEDRFPVFIRWAGVVIG